MSTIIPLPRRVTCKRDLEGHERNAHAAILGRTGLCDDPQPVFEKLPVGPTKTDFDTTVDQNLKVIIGAFDELETSTRARFFEVLSGIYCRDCGVLLERLPPDHSCSVVHLVCATEGGYEPAEWNVAAYTTFGADVMAAAHAARANARAVELREEPHAFREQPEHVPHHAFDERVVAPVIGRVGGQA